MEFDTLLREKYNFNMNPQQREAVLSIDGPMLLLASPGSGKTTIIAARCAYMVMYCGIAAENILTLTFNRSTQRDMEARFHRLFGKEAQGSLQFSTIHSFCISVLREYGALTGSAVPRLMQDGKPRLLRSLYAKCNDDEALPDDRMEELANTISNVKNMMLTDTQIMDGKYPIKNFCSIFVAYEQFMSTNGCMDFDDMLIKALKIFADRPDLLERFREQYRYINVDEAQDVTKLQHAIIRQLAAPRNNLFMAGDEDQTIYAFRASSPEYLREFKQNYPDCKILVTKRNYRSTHAIVDAANRLIKSKSYRHAVPMSTGNEIGLPLEEINLADNSLLCDHIVERLKNEDPGSCAILYRENTSAVAALDALDRAGIPFYIRDLRLRFFDHWVVRDILAFMALAQDPSDTQAFKQIYYKLNAYISQETYDLADNESCDNAIDALMKSPTLSDSAAIRLKRLKENIDKLPGMEPGRAVPYIMHKLGYLDYIKKAGNEGYGLESLLHIVESLRAIASRTANYAEMLERMSTLAAVIEHAKDNYGGNAVTLSTVHSAKGQEFDKVFIIDLFEGRFPLASAIPEMNGGKKELLEEERRLFYVAVTRARKQVELIYAAKINDERVKMSRFIRELHPYLPVHHSKPGQSDKQAGSLSKASAARRASGKKMIPKNQIPDSEMFTVEVGMDITHKSFGQGVVSSYDNENDIIAVNFPDHGLKTFRAALCINGGVIRRPGPADELVE